MKQKLNAKGFSPLVVIVSILLVAGLAFGGWFVWQKSEDKAKTNNSQTGQNKKDNSKSQQQTEPDETEDWTSVTTQGQAFSMKIPDGWKLTNFPNDYLGSLEPVHKPGTPAVIETSAAEYAGHSLRFRASITELDDAGLGPQWASPQSGLGESTEDFSIGTLQGKRYKGIFSGDLNQTLYEYVFDLGDNKKLDIVYAVFHDDGDVDDVATVEKAIKTIELRD